jgi:hypothetical protein
MRKFQKLTPVITDKDSFKNKIYREAFDFVFNNDELKNIAISGAYGAGKSSVFESYMHHYKSNEKIIHISLAHFKQLENCENISKSHDEALLQEKIINQLVHQINPSKIKKTNFIARIKDNWLSPILKSFGFLVVLMITIFLVFVDKFKPVLINFSNKFLLGIFSFFITSEGLLFLSAILFIIVFLFMLDLIQHSKGDNLIKKLSVKDIAFDFQEENAESFFDRYLTEIRYLFDRCDSKIIAIEDIDRYYSCSIFEKIRELNTVINYDRKKPIRFFYILNDEIFKSKERTKFFDFIIPVVPIVDASNSYSQLCSQLQEGGEGYELDNYFLRGLSIYIDDMRVLKNIINEFLIYQTELIKQELDPNKLLALITYKNLFPKDFNDLQIGTGYLFNLIESRDKFVENIITRDREELNRLEQEIEVINHENLQSLEELGALFLRPTRGIEAVNNQRIDSYDSHLTLFTEIKKNPIVVIWGNPSGQSTFDLTSKISDLQNNNNYTKRKILLDQKLKKGIESLEEEKLKIKSHIQAIQESHSISKFIDSTNIDYYLNLPLGKNSNNYNEISNDLHFQIVRFLILTGMIDGSYEDYLTYFYNNELKIKDQIYIRSIFDEKPLSLYHELTNPQAVLQVLEGVLENNPAFLNRSLFFYVFDYGKKDDCDKFIKLSKRYSIYELITDYLYEGKQIKLLIKILNNMWDSFYVDVEVPAKWSQENLNRFLQMELMYEEPELLQNININNDIRTDIEIDINLFDGISDENRAKYIKNLIAIGVKFHDINSLVNSDPFLADIYKNDLYIISVPNIHFWLKTVYNQQEYIEDGLLLSIVFSKSKEPLSIYTSNHLDDLVEDIISNNLTVKFKDNQNAINAILTSATTSFEMKSKYINRLLSQVEDVSQISDIEVIKLLLVKDLVMFSTNNLLALFVVFENTFTSELSSYLTKHENDCVRDKQINSALYSNEVVMEFFKLALSDSSLNKLVTEILLSATNIKITNQTSVIEEEKAKALISSKSLVMNDSNLAYIRKNHPKLIMEFEKKNLESFKVILVSEKNIDPIEIVNLLESDINWSEQRSLLSLVKVNIPYKESYQYPGVKKYIIKNLLDPQDIEKLIIDPKLKEDNLITATKTAIIKNIDFIIQKKLALPYTLFNELMISQSISQENLVEVFVNSLDLYTPEAIRKNIQALHMSPFDEMFNGKHPKYESTEFNQRILSILEKKDMAKRSIINGKLYTIGKYQ